VRARLAWLIAAFSAVCLVADALVVSAFQPLWSEATIAVHGWPLVNSAALGSAVMGAVIVSRYPRHPIGWLLNVVGGTTSLSMLCESLSLWVGSDGGTEPSTAGYAASLVAAMLGGPFALCMLTITFLLVPDGHLLSHRWRYVAAASVCGLVSFLLGVTQLPANAVLARAEPDNLGLLATVTITAGGLLVTTMLLASVASMVLRLRRATGEVRQQLRWIVAAAACVGGGLVFLLVGQALNGGRQTWITSLPLFVAYCLLPTFVAIAVLHHRLYDIDLIINRAVLLTVGTALVAGAYIVLVVGVVRAVGERNVGFWPSLLATVLVAMAFQPLRRRVVHLADRLAYGPRAVPYDSLSAFTQQIGRRPPPESLLPTVAEAAARAVSARSATVHLELASPPGLTATWLAPGQPATPDAPGGMAADLDVEVVDEGGHLGSIRVYVPPGRDVRPHEQQLIEDIADQAALAFRNVRLEAELSARVAAVTRRTELLEASRRRLIEAADAERQRLAAAIAREVLPTLRGMPARLDRLEREARTADVHDPVGELVDDATEVLESLRDLTRGVFPTVLTRSGLGPALSSSLFGRSGVSLVRVSAPAAQRRFPARVEAAAYFCCAQAVRSETLPDASVDVMLQDAHLLLDLRGVDLAAPDRQAMLDRVEAAGGSMEEADEPPPSVRVRLPLAVGDAS